MDDCRCTCPPFHHRDFESEPFGVDEPNCRYAEVTIETCKACGSRWLHYLVQYESHSQSGRWYRGPATTEDLATLTPDTIPLWLAKLAAYFYGGSYFQTSGRRGSGPVYVDLMGPPVGG